MMALHYGVGVLPARPRRLPGKAKVEIHVRLAKTCILSRLANRRFFSLAESNAAITEALERINGHHIWRLGDTRRELFKAIERGRSRRRPSGVLVARVHSLALAADSGGDGVGEQFQPAAQLDEPATRPADRLSSSRRKSAMVLKSETRCPISYISSTLRPTSGLSRRLDAPLLM